MGTRSERVLAACEQRLETSLRSRFIVEAQQGTLEAPAFAAYLAIEEHFVRTAARVAGYSLWQSPDWGRARRHAETVADLVGPQSDYFAAKRDRWPIDAESAVAALERSAVLSRYVLGATRDDDGYWAASTSMFAAESLYSRWCTDALRIRVSRSADLQEWIELHSTPEFAATAAQLGEIVDRTPDAIADDRSIAWFAGMLDAEDAFHSSIYESAE